MPDPTPGTGQLVYAWRGDDAVHKQGYTLQAVDLMGKVCDELTLVSESPIFMVNPGVVLCNEFTLQVVPAEGEPLVFTSIPEPSGIVLALTVLLVLKALRLGLAARGEK